MTNDEHNLDISPFSLQQTREVYKNRWITVREDRVLRPGGTEGIFGVITMKSGSSVLAITEQMEVFLTLEYKYGIGKSSLEVVSGAIDGTEHPLEAAKRELSEELGFDANDWIDCGRIDPFTTVVNSPNYMFICLGLRKTTQHLDPGETLTFQKVKLLRAIEMVMAGEITHGASCVLILKADRILRERGLVS